jgi:hypothetical protein
MPYSPATILLVLAVLFLVYILLNMRGTYL